MNVLHIGDELNWRGGENQIRLLVEGLRGQAQSVLAYPKRSLAVQRLRGVLPIVELPSSSTMDPRNIWVLLDAIKKYDIHILDAHSSGAHSMGLWVKKFREDLPLIVHRRVDNKIKSNFLSRGKYLSDYVNYFIAISHKIGEQLIAYGIPSHKVKVIRSAVHPRVVTREEKKRFKSQLAQKSQIDDSTIFIGCAAAFKVNQKGQDVLIKALIQMRNKNFHCFFAGTGTDLDAMKALSRHLGLADKVTFLGHVHEFKQFLASMDILVVPSRNEGLGTISLDGIFSGCLVVASNVGGIPEVIEDQRTGYLVTPEDPQQLCEKINRVMALVGDMSFLSQAQERTKMRFPVEDMINGNLDIYKQFV